MHGVYEGKLTAITAVNSFTGLSGIPAY